MGAGGADDPDGLNVSGGAKMSQKPEKIELYSPTEEAMLMRALELAEMRTRFRCSPGVGEPALRLRLLEAGV